jgi:hypothetical protein
MRLTERGRAHALDDDRAGAVALSVVGARLPSRWCLAPSDGHRELVEGHRDAELERLVRRGFVVAASKVLDEGMPRDDYPSADVGIEATHRAQSSLELPCGRPRCGRGVPLGAMPGRRIIDCVSAPVNTSTIDSLYPHAGITVRRA